MTALLDAARDLFDDLDREAALAEDAGTPMTDHAVALCREAGLYGAMITRDAGGAELSIGDSLDVFKELARADGSTGWVVMASSSAAAYFSAWCPDSFVQQAFGGDQVPLVAGQFAPNGVAVPADDAYRITGSYNFGSGIEHAEWVGCGSFTQPTDGSPGDYVFALVPKDEAAITGNWDVLGLRATASYDYSIDSTVPADRMFSFGGHTRHRGGPMYDLGVLCLTEVGHAGWVLGVLRRAIDEAALIARTKQRMTGKSTLADDPRFQYDLAMAESTLQSGELWIRDAFGRAERSVLEGDGPDPAADSDARQATTFLTQRACRVVQDLYLHIGTTALRDGPFQRCFRDLHAGSQHAMVSPMHTYEFAGRLLADPEASG
ncbi:MAG: acyl-CoA dehydrogenase family protein [Actinomycetota bacterium]